MPARDSQATRGAAHEKPRRGRSGAWLEETIRARGLELGFARVGFAHAGRSARAEAFKQWIEQGYSGEMGYMAREPEERADLTKRFPWVRTVISVSLNYANRLAQEGLRKSAPASPVHAGPWPAEGREPRWGGHKGREGSGPAAEHSRGGPAAEHSRGGPAAEHSCGGPAAEHSCGGPAAEHSRGSPAAEHSRGGPASDGAPGPADGEASSGSSRFASRGDGRLAAEAGSDSEAGIARLVSQYAVGLDYHEVLKRRLAELARHVQAEGGGRAETRWLVDTSAILERDYAFAGGLGWTGKNAMVIDPQRGSYSFLGEILTDLELTPEYEMEDLCGSCTRCIDACPTGAIVEARVVDARRCISYLTIELKGAIEPALRGQIGEHLFGCDICQDVCPWNSRAVMTGEPELRAGAAVELTTLEESVGMDATLFAQRFRGSPLKRAKRSGFLRNALIVAANRRDGAALRAARRVLDDPDPVLRETAVWALARGDGADRRLAGLRAERDPDPPARSAMRKARDLDGA